MDIAEFHPQQTIQLIERAVEQGNLDLLKQFLTLDYVNINTLSNRSGLNMLMLAAWKGQLNVVSFLLDQNVDLEAVDMEGKTALMFATWSGHPAIVDLLLNRGAHLYATSFHGVTPFTLSLESGSKETVFRLLAASAESDLNMYISKSAKDLVFEFNQQLMACRNKLTDIFRPMVRNQNNITISSAQMKVLCQEFPEWYACLIKDDLEFVCTNLYRMKADEQIAQQQAMMTAPVLFTLVAPPIPLVVNKRKPNSDVDQARKNKKQK